MLRSRAGLVTAYGDPSSIPDDTRFEIGGVGLNGLRGYENRSILPEGNEVTGGRTMLIVATELKFPISEEKFPIHGLLFAEAGNTWNSVDDTDPSSLYVGAGAGIRIEVPILGSIGVDMGYGFDEELGGDWIAHYQFGFDYW
jgi:outer membrane protein insertion porin family